MPPNTSKNDSAFSQLSLTRPPAQRIEQWAANRTEKVPFSILKNAVVAVDASYYLDLRVNDPENEPILHALNGVPYSLRDFLEQDIKALRKAQINLIFVFDGLDYANKRQQAGSPSPATQRALETAWQHYFNGDGDKTRSDFSRASKCATDQTETMSKQADYPVGILYRYVQNLLAEFKVQYQVAPYSAAAQVSSPRVRWLLH